MPEFVRVIDVAEVPDPGKTLVEVDGEMVALFHVCLLYTSPSPRDRG